MRNGKLVDVRSSVDDILRGVSPESATEDASAQADAEELLDFPVAPVLKPGATMRAKAGNAAALRFAALADGAASSGDDSAAVAAPPLAASDPARPGSIFDTAAAGAGALPDARAWTLRRAHAEDWACLKVRLADGGTVDVRLPFAATLSMAYEEVRRARGDRNVGFELRAAMPPRAFADDNTTLEDAGLTPSAAIFVREL